MSSQEFCPCPWSCMVSSLPKSWKWCSCKLNQFMSLFISNHSKTVWCQVRSEVPDMVCNLLPACGTSLTPCSLPAAPQPPGHLILLPAVSNAHLLRGFVIAAPHSGVPFPWILNAYPSALRSNVIISVRCFSENFCLKYKNKSSHMPIIVSSLMCRKQSC